MRIAKINNIIIVAIKCSAAPIYGPETSENVYILKHKGH